MAMSDLVDTQDLLVADPPEDPAARTRAAMRTAREQMTAARQRVKTAVGALIDTSLQTARSGRSVSSDKLRAVKPPEPTGDLTGRFKALREPA